MGPGRFFRAAGLCLLLAGSARAGAIEDAQAAYAAGDFTRAVALFKTLAEQGDPVAQYNLGVLYENGQGVPKDYVLAVDWYRKGADQGYAEAQNNLANMYAFGLGVTQDPAEAVLWMRKAAQQGQSGAQFNLGIMYTLGQGVPKDYAQAEAWLRLAAEQGEAEAQYNLGVMYERGDGVAPDAVEAYSWYLLAVGAGFAPALEKQGAFGGSLTAEQRAEAKKRAADRRNAAAQAAAAAAPAPPPAPGRGMAALFFLAVLAVLAATWKFFRRGAPGGGQAASARGFRPLEEKALLQAAGNPKECVKVARYYKDAGRSAEFTAQKGRPAMFYGAYSRAFLKLGDLPGALALLEQKESPDSNDDILVWTLQKALSEHGGASELSWSVKLAAATDLSVQGLHDEALSLVDDEMMSETDNVSIAGRVAALYRAAGREAEFRQRPRPPRRT